MSVKVKSQSIGHRGFRSEMEKMDKGRVKISSLKAPKGTQITHSMLEAAVKQVKHDDLLSLRLNDDNEVVIVPETTRPKTVQQACKIDEKIEQLSDRVYRQLVNALISEIRKAKRRARRKATTKPSGFVNDKSRTRSTVPAQSPA